MFTINDIYICVFRWRTLPSSSVSILKNYVTRLYNFFLRAGKLYLEAFSSKMRSLLLEVPNSLTFGTTAFY